MCGTSERCREGPRPCLLPLAAAATTAHDTRLSCCSPCTSATPTPAHYSLLQVLVRLAELVLQLLHGRTVLALGRRQLPLQRRDLVGRGPHRVQPLSLLLQGGGWVTAGACMHRSSAAQWRHRAQASCAIAGISHCRAKGCCPLHKGLHLPLPWYGVSVGTPKYRSCMHACLRVRISMCGCVQAGVCVRAAASACSPCRNAP